jgi:hypothetical protein
VICRARSVGGDGSSKGWPTAGVGDGECTNGGGEGASAGPRSGVGDSGVDARLRGGVGGSGRGVIVITRDGLSSVAACASSSWHMVRPKAFEGSNWQKHAPSVRARQSRTSEPRSARRTAAERGSRRSAREGGWGSPGGMSVWSRNAPRALPRAARAGPRVLRRAVGPQNALHAHARTPRAVRRGVRRSMRGRQRSTSSAAARGGDAAWVGLSIIANEQLSHEKEEKNGQARLVDESPLCGQRL